MSGFAFASPFSLERSTAWATSLALGCLFTPAAQAQKNCEGPGSRSPLQLQLDQVIEQRGLSPVPATPPIRPALRDLGQLLNFDPILSGNQDISCATCHHPFMNTGDARHLPLGTGGQELGLARVGGGLVPRNAPPLFNLHAYETIFWDNRIDQSKAQIFTPGDEDLTPAIRETWEFGIVSAQAMFPVTSHTEMRGEVGENPIANAKNKAELWELLTQRVLAVPEYRARLTQAYPGQEDFNFGHIANALAAFEIDAFAQAQSPWQRYLNGDAHALSQAQIQGALTFFDSGCAECHSGPLFSDFKVHNTGLAPVGPGKGMGESGLEDWGRMNVTGAFEDKFRFRTAPLVNVELTGPYGHAGQFNTLREYLEHYQDPEKSFNTYDTCLRVHSYEPLLWFILAPSSEQILSTIDEKVLALKPFEIDQILDFLGALTDPAAKDLSHIIPASVPSELEMDVLPESLSHP